MNLVLQGRSESIEETGVSGDKVQTHCREGASTAPMTNPKL